LGTDYLPYKRAGQSVCSLNEYDGQNSMCRGRKLFHYGFYRYGTPATEAVGGTAAELDDLIPRHSINLDSKPSLVIDENEWFLSRVLPEKVMGLPDCNRLFRTSKEAVCHSGTEINHGFLDQVICQRGCCRK